MSCLIIDAMAQAICGSMSAAVGEAACDRPEPCEPCRSHAVAALLALAGLSQALRQRPIRPTLAVDNTQAGPRHDRLG